MTTSETSLLAKLVYFEHQLRYELHVQAQEHELIVPLNDRPGRFLHALHLTLVEDVSKKRNLRWPSARPARVLAQVHTERIGHAINCPTAIFGAYEALLREVQRAKKASSSWPFEAPAIALKVNLLHATKVQFGVVPGLDLRFSIE